MNTLLYLAHSAPNTPFGYVDLKRTTSSRWIFGIERTSGILDTKPSYWGHFWQGIASSLCSSPAAWPLGATELQQLSLQATTGQLGTEFATDPVEAMDPEVWGTLGTLGTLGLLGQMANADAGGAARTWRNAQWKGSTRLGITLSVIQTPTWLLYFCVFSLQKKQVRSREQITKYKKCSSLLTSSHFQLGGFSSLRFSRCSSTILNRQPLSLWNDRPTMSNTCQGIDCCNSIETCPYRSASHRRVSVQPLCGLLGIMGSFKHPFGLFGLGRNDVPMLERHCQHSTFFSFLGRGLCMAHGSALACPNPLLQCSCSPQIFSGIWRRVEPRNWFSENRTMASQWSRMGPGSKLIEQTVDTCCCLCNRWKCNESWAAYPARNHQHSYMKLERSTEIYCQRVTYITYII